MAAEHRTPLRLSEAQKRSVACPTCHASAGAACRGSETSASLSLRSGRSEHQSPRSLLGGPPDLERAHDARRQAALRAQAAKIATSSTYGKTNATPAAAAPATPPSKASSKAKAKTKLVTVMSVHRAEGNGRSLVGRVFPLAPRVEAGLVPCTGEAHSNAFIDNCMICAPRWGEMMSYEPLTPAACQEGFAVPFGAGGDRKNRDAFDAAEEAGEITLVTVTTKSSSFSAWVATGCVAHSDCAATPELGQACAEDTRPAADATKAVAS